MVRYGGLSLIQTARQNLYPAFHTVHPLYEPLQGEGLTPIHECSTTLEDEDEEGGGVLRQGVGVGVFPHVYTSPFLGNDDLGEGVGVGGEDVGEGGGAFLPPIHEGRLLMTTDLDVYLSESGSGPSVHHLENHLSPQQQQPVRK